MGIAAEVEGATNGVLVRADGVLVKEELAAGAAVLDGSEAREGTEEAGAREELAITSLAGL